MTRLEPKHWAVLGTFIVSLAAMVAGLDHWGDATHPAFVAGVLGQLGALVSAIFVGAPVNPNLSPNNNPARRADDPAIPPALGSVSDATRSKL